jgi:hypothetical protein
MLVDITKLGDVEEERNRLRPRFVPEKLVPVR